MRIAVRFLIFILIVYSLCSCQSITDSDTYASSFPESTPNFSKPDFDNQEEVKSIYQFNKPLIENDAFFEIEPLDLPSEINGMKLAPSIILSETQLLVLLYEEYTVPIIKEVGVYELTSGEYSFSFAVDESKAISIEWAADDLVVYKETDSASNAVCLHCFRLDTGENLVVHQFSQGYSDTSAFHMNLEQEIIK